MTDPYMTTDEIRSFFGSGLSNFGPDEYTDADFNKWLDQHDRQVLMSAADKAFKDKSIQGLARATIGNWLRMQAAK